jgi:hypothetical protein
MRDVPGRDGTPGEFTWRGEVVVSTVLVVIGFIGAAGTIGLSWLVYCLVNKYDEQKVTIGGMQDANKRDRTKIEILESSVAERDETIDGLIAKIEGLDKSYRVKCGELDARNCELLAMRNKAKEIFTTSFASNSVTSADQ